MIKCPKCGSENVEITSGTYNKYRNPKEITMRLAILFGSLLAIFIGGKINFPILSTIGAFAFLGLLIYAGITKTKANPNVIHTKAICKNCGHIEYLD